MKKDDMNNIVKTLTDMAILKNEKEREMKDNK